MGQVAASVLMLVIRPRTVRIIPHNTQCVKLSFVYLIFKHVYFKLQSEMEAVPETRSNLTTIVRLPRRALTTDSLVPIFKVRFNSSKSFIHFEMLS